MTSRQIEILELFAEVANDYADRQVYRMREGFIPVVKHDISKRAWALSNKTKKSIYDARNYARKTGKPLPPLERVKVELFWDGNGWYVARPLSSERLGGPFDALHDAWKTADTNQLEVVTVNVTRGQRSYR